MSDGRVIIKVDANTDAFDKKINGLGKKADKTEKQIEYLERKRATTTKKRDELQKDIDIKKDNSDDIKKQILDLEKQMNESDKINKEYFDLEEKIFSGKNVTTGDYRKYSTMSPVNMEDMYDRRDILEKKLNETTLEVEKSTRRYEEQDNAIKTINDRIEEQKSNLADVRQNLESIIQLQNESNNKQNESNINSEEASEILKDSGKKVGNVLKGLGRTALAVFGIRSAYMAVRQAMSTISQYDDQMRVNLEYIRFALAMAIKPIIDWIVQQVFKILQYVNYIYHTWTGKNLFANSGIDAFQKKLDKIQKQLYGFDEANVLGNKDEATPNIDLSKSLPSDNEVPAWVKALGDLSNHREELVEIFATATAFFVLLKTASVLRALNLIGTSANIVASKSGAIIGLIGAILGFFMLKNDIIDFIDSPSWGNFFDILSDIAIIVGSLMIMMGNWNGIIPLVAGVIGKLGIKFLNASDSAKKEYDAEKDLEQAHRDLKDASDNLYDATDKYERALANSEEAHKKLKDAEDETKISGEDLFEKVKNGTLHYKDMTDQQKKVYDAFIDTKKAEEQLSDASDKVKQANQDMEYANLEIQRSNDITAGNFDDYKDKVIKAYDDQKISAQQAADLLQPIYDQMDADAKETFTEKLPDEIKKVWDESNYTSSKASFKSSWDNFWNSLATSISTFVSTIIQNIKDIFDKDNYDMSSDKFKQNSGTRRQLTRWAIGDTGGVYAKGALVKMAGGGAITNNPGRGVPLSSVITGEAGAEGIIPLTNAGTMTQLGEMIGKYATVNTQNNIYLDSRRIAREMTRTQNNNDFLLNN